MGKKENQYFSGCFLRLSLLNILDIKGAFYQHMHHGYVTQQKGMQCTETRTRSMEIYYMYRIVPVHVLFADRSTVFNLHYHFLLSLRQHLSDIMIV